MRTGRLQTFGFSGFETVFGHGRQSFSKLVRKSDESAHVLYLLWSSAATVPFAYSLQRQMQIAPSLPMFWVYFRNRHTQGWPLFPLRYDSYSWTRVTPGVLLICTRLYMMTLFGEDVLWNSFVALRTSFSSDLLVGGLSYTRYCIWFNQSTTTPCDRMWKRFRCRNEHNDLQRTYF